MMVNNPVNFEKLKSLFQKYNLSRLPIVGCIFAAFTCVPAAALPHSATCSNTGEVNDIFTGSRQSKFADPDDKVFRDNTGREVFFRGWNISGNTKLAESGFKPYRSLEDADNDLNRIRQETGANLIRFCIAWEGVNPDVDRIDFKYLDDILGQIKLAVSKGMYVLLDYHEDLYSRYLFNQDSWHTGNGAPDYVVRGYPKEYAGPVCTNWGQHLLTNGAVRLAFRNFWNDVDFITRNGVRKPQECFLFQLEATLRYIGENLSPEEMSQLVGVDPFNEPADGGMDGLTPKEWTNQKLWPFYHKCRRVMDACGWYNKQLYAEPLVFWNSNVGFVCPATGSKLLDDIPERGFVLNVHMYDAARRSWNFTNPSSGCYFSNYDAIRDFGRYMKMPVLVSEFGMANGGIGAKDPAAMLAAMYQAMETTADGKTPVRPRFYVQPLSGTQWQWDYYYDHHNEYQNFNPDKLLTAADAWNGEDFSVVKDYGRNYNYCKYVFCRAYPRRIQGDMISFYYNTLATDAWNKLLNWAELSDNDSYRMLRDKQFMLLIWSGKTSDYPTEVFIPNYFKPSNMLIVSDLQGITAAPAVTDKPMDTENEIVLMSDSGSESGYRLLSWNDSEQAGRSDSLHYLLVVNDGAELNPDLRQKLYSILNKSILVEQVNPLFLP
ncbi:cellulase family glycosylhydrolase [Lentisphaerota bacterium ZTH]|nr:cellulase family glycosylhydrolase [Lentisphaerota bacterium]WET06290.1 cellulase family glycosylhydrolase [Lentisphaerota bacterium ZTH]